GGFTAAHMAVPRMILGQRTFPPPDWVEQRIASRFRDAYTALLAKPNMIMINISTASAEAYTSWLGCGRVISIVRNGFDPRGSERPSPDVVAGFRRGMGIPEEAPVVGTVMRFAPEKDPELWLQTAAAVAAGRSDAHFILNGYGHDDIAARLYIQGEQLGLKGRLHMPAVIGDVGRVYALLSVFLLTSRTDATPNALLEAQAAGVPVVAPAIGGIAETVLDGITGIVVRERSVAALSTAVLDVLDQPEFSRRASTQGPSFVEQKFGLDRMIEETIAAWA
ncbi:MAG TPA: glycosyltransferase, partial [Stellaceae bacterium]|nr:glycosyltransferase [Stellaceae bacterium]